MPSVKPKKGMIVNSLALSSNVKTVRLEHGWSRESLAKKTKLTCQTIYNIEAGRVACIKVSTLADISKALGRSMDDMIGTGFRVSINMDVRVMNRLSSLATKNGYHNVEHYIMSL